MTPPERVQYKGWFPALDVDAAVVTAENNATYNCISWTVGVTTAWHWPGSTIQDFDSFYASFGYYRKTTGPVAAWGHSLQDMLHGSVSGAGHGPRWESKCGALLRIQHGRDELTSTTYGHIVAFYRRSWLWYLIRLIARIFYRRFKVDLTSVRILDDAVLRMDPALRERFDHLFAEWKASWRDPAVAIHSNPAFVRRLPAFDALVALGPETLPALALKLADPDNFFALQLYEALQPEDYARQAKATGAQPSDGEQGRAMRVAELYARSLSRQEPSVR
jgi:hypothetical protein